MGRMGLSVKEEERLRAAMGLMADARELDRKALRTRAAAAGLFEEALKGVPQGSREARSRIGDAKWFMARAREAERGEASPSLPGLSRAAMARWRREMAAREFELALEEMGILLKVRK